jgi:ribosomal protein S18 acetylase RimI-like enzyme
MFVWKKYGVIFDPRKANFHWAGATQSYAQSPQAIVLDDRVRVFFSTREKETQSSFVQSQVCFVDFDFSFQNIVAIQTRPVISLGALGHFDEHGIFPLSPFWDDGILKAYTTGWSRRVSVSVETGIGYATSLDNGLKFTKFGSGPILSAWRNEPFLVGDAFVRKFNGLYYMWYIAGQSWIDTNNNAERVYKIFQATSKDGIDWSGRDSKPILPNSLGIDECQALPSVIYFNNLYHMVFCFRDAIDFRDKKDHAYRLGYATSPDLIHWTRNDEALCLERPEQGWDSDMMCYPHWVQTPDGIFLLYNGNSFGKDGFGAAKLFHKTFNQSHAEDIEAHLLSLESEFLNDLEARVHIPDYSQKLAQKAERVEFWNCQHLSGLCAFYINKQENKLFLSHIGFAPDAQGQGFAEQSLKDMVALARKHHIGNLQLQVHEKNKKALALYRKMGFVTIEHKDNFLHFNLFVSSV